MSVKILLICGSGASTSFLVQNMRKIAKERGIDAFIEARSDSQLADLLNTVDVVLAGPHLKYQEERLRTICNEQAIPFAFIPPLVYGTFDGEKALDMALELTAGIGGEQQQ